MKYLRLALSCCVLTFTVLATAQEQQNSQQDPQQNNQDQQNNPSNDASSNAPAGQDNQNARGNQTNAKGPMSMAYLAEVLDEDLTSESGEEIGDIEDCIVTTDGRIQYWIVEVDDVNLAIPGESIRAEVSRKEGERTVTPILRGLSKADLKKAPRLESDKYSELNDESWRSRNGEIFQVQGPKIDPKADFLKTSMMMGAIVYSNDDNRLADVDYLVVDSGQSIIRYALIDHETTVTDTELVAVPFTSLRWMITNDGKLFARLNASMADLDRSPRVAVDNIVQFANEEWLNKVNQAFPRPSSPNAN